MRRRGESLDRADGAVRNLRWQRESFPNGLGSPAGPKGNGVKSLTEQVREIDTLGRAWHVIYENGRSSLSLDTRRQIKEFALRALSRITKIQRQLNMGAFQFEPAKGIAVPKGKNGIRPIVVAPVESRIVQRAIHDVLLKVPSIRQYAEDPFSFGGVRKAQGKNLAAVPAAIRAVLDAIESGSRYVIRSDISSFFARIPKPTVTAIVARATNDAKFMELFNEAIRVELQNLVALRQSIVEFPIHEIGVAQGNSLSPLLGNLLLYEFDSEMNSGICTCIRYVDDFIILAPDRAVAEHQFCRGLQLLKEHGLTVNEKTVRTDVKRPFTFLGIDLSNGAIRPSEKSRKRLLTRIEEVLEDGVRACRSHKKTGRMDQSASLVRTLYEVRGIVTGWGKHYSFCNETNIFAQLDEAIDKRVGSYLGAYRDARKGTDRRGSRHLIGVPLLEDFVSDPFVWKTMRVTTPPPLRANLPQAHAAAQ
jgi:retron-type reverse transcriptase